jgi:ubiquinone/menaquinone biosynthesis C-methylase UbiE
VYATDVQPEMLRMLVANAREAGVKNIKPVRCTTSDPKLPEGQVDLILMVDVYHECSEPEATLQGLRKALKPGGRLVLVEFRAEDPEVPIKPEHKMTLAQVRRELEPQGLTFMKSLEFLPWQHIIIFEKALGADAKAPVTGSATEK